MSLVDNILSSTVLTFSSLCVVRNNKVQTKQQAFSVFIVHILFYLPNISRGIQYLL